MRLTLAIALLVALPSCSESGGSARTIVASIYPLAFAAERMAPDAEVIDLTPPGVEAHDLELSLEQRSAIQHAEVVLYVGDIGFQPQVERAASQGEGILGTIHTLQPAATGGTDPHFWLAPGTMASGLLDVSSALSSAGIDPQLEALAQDIDELDRDYKARLVSCRYRTMITPHEAFGYVASLYRLNQFGLTGLTPESEPTADRLAEARQLVDNGQAAALFYEARGEDIEADRALAQDLGVPAIPLDTLESEPPAGDYLSVMQDNLEGLREGLQCP